MDHKERSGLRWSSARIKSMLKRGLDVERPWLINTYLYMLLVF